ncbi:heat shock protein 70kD, putative [Entamoeba dispar SAW760]|uniref:Heat shock protein 70kD, putative n=1 Tax=Entamoeba dispar (strain ATCC PRA-260 / SAW760) TaxID=370354 RepID=B0EV18_ENTDS|nr:heat shock protein 70kD, putative [Entamoeba dispar SAW760]EDR21634.1 heat shock protein 70kD, putative [Entamoeba dispar SAW760]|eukprot:EDR21634.1 heat shock protein 70kD, putative [Entamoeba dispar SAW760]
MCLFLNSFFLSCHQTQSYNIHLMNVQEELSISGMILKYLYEIAQEKLGNHPISNTKLACKLAGIKNVELENEPVAVIIEYKREYQSLLKNGDKIVVIDFGRTLDVSCCKIANDNIIVESSGGNQNLGGNNFDKNYYYMMIMDMILLLIRLLQEKEFEDECYRIHEEFINKIKQVTQKRHKRGDIKLVILNSGTCKIPRIREEVAKLFDIQTFSDNNFNPLNAVVKGAAYLAQEIAMCYEVIYDNVPTPIGIELEG